MKKFFALILLVCMLAMTVVTASAETKNYSFSLTPTSSANGYRYGYAGTKADNENRYYVTQTTNSFGNRTIYYRAVYTNGTGLSEVSNIITMTSNTSKNASYIKSVAAGDKYALAAIVKANGIDDVNRSVSGRWTP